MPVFTSDVSVDSTVGLTDAELRATPVPVDASGTTVPVSGPLTDTELRATPVPISGTVTTNVGTGTQPISGTVDVSSVSGTVTVTGSVSTTPSAAASSTVTQITSNSANQTLLASNASRKKAILFFTSGIWNIKLGTGATTTSFTYLVNSSNTTIEVTVWTGQIDAICTTSNKLVNVTELS